MKYGRQKDMGLRPSTAWTSPVDVAYVEGRRRLRMSDLWGAAVFLEAAWYTNQGLAPPPDALVHDELSGDRVSSSSSAPSATPAVQQQSPRSRATLAPRQSVAATSKDPPAGAGHAVEEGRSRRSVREEVDDGRGEPSEGEAEHRPAPAPKADDDDTSDGPSSLDSSEDSPPASSARTAEVPAAPSHPSSPSAARSGGGRQTRQPAPKQLTDREIKLPLWLCLAYSKLQLWDKVERTARAVLETLGVQDGKPMPGISRLARERHEELWIRLMIHRGVACAFLGVEHFARAKGCFAMAQRVQPRNRDAARGLQCMRFLEEQLSGGSGNDEACSTALSALAASVTPDPASSRSASRVSRRRSGRSVA